MSAPNMDAPNMGTPDMDGSGMDAPDMGAPNLGTPDMDAPVAIIIGAGPGGLTAAWELLHRTGVRPVVVEASGHIGGISRTLEHNGNRLDLGGHRFFSKSGRVMRWWFDMLPPEGSAAAAAAGDAVMMERPRTSRILFGGRLFRYPLSLSLDTVAKLGAGSTLVYGLSYARARLRPIRPERSLEDFFVNRFGRALYRRFFRDYTEKVWGVPCSRISPDWGAQRVKGLSITRVLAHALRRLARRGGSGTGAVETSLIERFHYPRLGPGQLWETVAARVRAAGGEILMGRRAVKLHHADGRVHAVTVRDETTGAVQRLKADHVISTMPVSELVAGLEPAAPETIGAVAAGLVYRDFMTAGLLVDRLELGGGTTGRELAAKVPDTWIYVQEPGVRLGRLQIFNNWSPHMVADPDRIWLGLEYFCTEGDDLWRLADEDFLALAIDEVVRLGLVRRAAVRDGTVARMPKAYPAYFGTYGRFDELREYLDGFANLFPVGRNGMHRYNNQDHSMLTAMAAVEAIAVGRTDKAAIWAVNAEQDYHESGDPAGQDGQDGQPAGADATAGACAAGAA